MPEFGIFSVPIRVYGEGDYALTDVKEVVGTDEYITLAKKKGLCTEAGYQACLNTDYKRRGLEKCDCTPYFLRNYSKQVR